MKSEFYSQFLGIVRSVNDPDAPQVAFLNLDNYLPNDIKGCPVKRGGSYAWSGTGDILGIGGYSKRSSSALVPNIVYPTRHRRNGSTSYIEYLNWGTDTWTAITQGANTSFGVNGVTQFHQFYDMLGIFGGRPAKLTDPLAGTITRLGGPAPTTAPTWGTSGTGLTGTTIGFYTFYDSTTGWESSPSPFTSLTTLSNQQLDWSALETTCAREGVDKKRLYRTQVAAEGEPPYYRVTEIALATTTYADTVADASLTNLGPEIGDHDPPPSDSYIAIQYANCLWIASGNELWRSATYDGTNASLEYFSDTRRYFFPQRITGLAYSPEFGRLLVFCPPGYGIHYIAGRNEATFEQDIFKMNEGSNFTSSIAIHEDRLAYWGQSGPTILTPQGEIEDSLADARQLVQDIATKQYNSSVYIWCVWHPFYQQFVWSFSATDTASASWEDVVSGEDVLWTDSVTGADVEWG